ncbi:hypothetical protein DL98DRAFT_71539 [Cadophora sp. DSE1049]|nr:hypothetical protein DL98DRAFT_71539 [Cadophora sp. DSE1049]
MYTHGHTHQREPCPLMNPSLSDPTCAGRLNRVRGERGAWRGDFWGLELTVCSGMERGTKLFGGRSARVGRGCLAIFRGKHIANTFLSIFCVTSFFLESQSRRQRCEDGADMTYGVNSSHRSVGQIRRTVRGGASRWLETGGEAIAAGRVASANSDKDIHPPHRHSSNIRRFSRSPQMQSRREEY